MHRFLRLPLAAALAVALATGLAACTVPRTSLPSRTASAAPTPTATATRISVQAASTRAVRAVQNGAAVSVEDESDGAEFAVRVVLDDGEEREVHLAAADGRVLAGPSALPTDADDRSANRALIAAPTVNLGTAADRMLAAVPSGRITAIALESYDDRVVWQGDVLNARGVRQDVRIDAVNGSVLLNQTDGATPAPGS